MLQSLTPITFSHQLLLSLTFITCGHHCQLSFQASSKYIWNCKDAHIKNPYQILSIVITLLNNRFRLSFLKCLCHIEKHFRCNSLFSKYYATFVLIRTTYSLVSWKFGCKGLCILIKLSPLTVCPPKKHDIMHFV